MYVRVQYKGNYDWYKAYDRLYGSPEVASLDVTEKGLIRVRFKGASYFCVISPQGTVLIQSSDEREKKRLHYMLQRYLGELEPVTIGLKSEFMQFISLFPLPTKLSFSACETTFTYSLSWWNPRARPPLRDRLVEYLPFIVPYSVLLAILAAAFAIVTFGIGVIPIVLWCFSSALAIAKYKLKLGCIFSALMAITVWLL